MAYRHSWWWFCRRRWYSARNSANDDAQSGDDDDEPASVLESLLGSQVVQREDTACNENGEDVSVGVDVDAVVGVGVHGQGVNLGQSRCRSSWGARQADGLYPRIRRGRRSRTRVPTDLY